MREIQEGLSVRLSDNGLFDDYFISPENLVNCCESLVVFDKVSQIVRFTHYTIYEFLRINYLTQLLSDVDLARVCLTYITFAVFRGGPCPDFEAMNTRYQTHRFGSYAIDYWCVHTKGVGEHDSEIRKFLLQLSSSVPNLDAILQFQEFNKIQALKVSNSDWNWASNNSTMLHIAAENGLLVVVQLLLEV